MPVWTCFIYEIGFERLASVDFFSTQWRDLGKNIVNLHNERRLQSRSTRNLHGNLLSKLETGVPVISKNYLASWNLPRFLGSIYRVPTAQGRIRWKKKFFKIREFYFDWGKNEILKNKSRVKLDGNDNTADVILMKAGRNISGQLLVIPTMFPFESENCWKLVKLNFSVERTVVRGRIKFTAIFDISFLLGLRNFIFIKK